MAPVSFFLALVVSAISVMALPQQQQSSGVIPVQSSPPAGFQLASSTSDHESLSQQGPCTACNVGISTISGPSNLGQGVFTSAGSPSIFGDNTQCGACGACYSVINTGAPFCTGCGGSTQTGPQNITLMITNSCTDCTPSATKGNFHFDILNAPQGWGEFHIPSAPHSPWEHR